MKQNLHLVAVSVALAFSFSAVNAQTVSTFDDLSLPGANTDFSASIPNGQDYSFQSGLVKFYGVKESWGGYGAFNYTNVVDTVTESFTNDKAAVTGGGVNGSSNYGVAYVNSDWPANPTHALPIGAKLQGAASGSKVVGFFVTNTTYGYGYMRDVYGVGDFLKLVVKGYTANAVVPDSVVVTLGEVTSTDTVLLKTWEWVDLLSLGDVDSITFEMYSTDELTPFYFAIDDVATLDGSCPLPSNIVATSVNETSASIFWDNGLTGYQPTYEIVIDQSATLAPTGTPTTVNAITHTENNLTPNTTYYVHLRAACDGANNSAWDTLSFKTLQNMSINGFGKQGFAIQLSPNPAVSFIQLTTDVNFEAHILSIEGRVVAKNITSKNIDIASLPNGIYILKATDNEGRTAQFKFVKH